MYYSLGLFFSLLTHELHQILNCKRLFIFRVDACDENKVLGLV